MWGVSLSWLLLLTTASTPVAVGGPILPVPIYTRQTSFSIPFRIDRAERTATEPVAVQLQVSVDRGTTWRAQGRIPPNAGRFEFRAAADGEYWFAVQTIDNQNRLRPPKADAPGLRVIVDTALPKLELGAHRGPNGEITVRWQITEPNLDPGSVQIAYRTNVSPTMQSVAIDRNRLAGENLVHMGDASWWLQDGGSRVEIRAEARDRAGNIAVTNAQVSLADPPPAETAANSPPPGTMPATGAPALQGQGNARRPLLHTASLPMPEASVAIQINPAIGNRYGQQAAESSRGVAGSDEPRMVNTRMFELEYAVDSVGPSGIARVELWGTRDGGQTWTSLGVDEDKKSPFLVSVPEEGMYGFRITVRSGVGIGGEPPALGAAPEARIGVDLTKPDVRIVSAEQLTGKDSGKLVVSWEARDRMLARQGISLFYSVSPGGPWQPIAVGLENSGQYAWMADKDVPERIYLRVEARDEAGNLGIFESPQAVALDRVHPNVHIRDIRPVGQSADGAADRLRR